MDAGILHEAIAAVSPVISVRVGDGTDRASWAWEPGVGATQAQIDAGNNVVATIPVNATGTFRSLAQLKPWTTAELTQLKNRFVANGILTQARADIIFG